MTTATARRYDADEVKAAARGRWVELFTAAGVSHEYLDGKHHPCPNCGGHDRFRLTDAETGAAFCNQCFNKKRGDNKRDGLSTLRWLTGKTFPEVLDMVAEQVGLANGNGSSRRRENVQHAAQPDLSRRRDNPKPPQAFPTIEAAVAAVSNYSFCPWRKNPPVGQWPYRNAEGLIVAWVYRWAKPTENGKVEKDIVPFTLTPRGWTNQHMETPRYLYNLPEVIDAAEVFIVEGEKCVDALQQIGIVATTSPGGSNAGDKADWTPLSGKRVTFWRDNDDPGIKYRDGVVEILHQLDPPAEVVVIDESVVTSLLHKGDVVDWLEQFDSVEPDQLRENILNLKTSAVADKTPEFDIEVINVNSLIERHPQQNRPIIDGILRERETMNLIAATKIGKTFLTMGMAYCVANGEPWLGHETERGRVLLIDNELHPATLAYRLQCVRTANNLKADHIDAVSLRGKGMDIARLLAFIRSKVAASGYKLICLDALYRFLPSGTSENDNAAMMHVYNAVDQIADEAKAAIVLVHHTSKGNQAEKTTTDVGAGAGSISRAADTHLIIRPHEIENCAVVDVATRSFVSPDPLTIKWEYPLWYPMDIAPQVKLPPNPKQAATDRETLETIENLLPDAGEEGLTASQIRKAADWGDSRAKRAMSLAVKHKIAVRETGRTGANGVEKPDRIISTKFNPIGGF